jgi:hypothetical protein
LTSRAARRLILKRPSLMSSATVIAKPAKPFRYQQRCQPAPVEDSARKWGCSSVGPVPPENGLSSVPELSNSCIR